MLGHHLGHHMFRFYCSREQKTYGWTDLSDSVLDLVNPMLNWYLCFRFGLRERDFCERQPRWDRQRQQQSQHQQVQYSTTNNNNSKSSRPSNKKPSGKLRENEENLSWAQYLKTRVRLLNISVADPDPGSGAFLTPGSGMGKNQPGSYFRELRNNILGSDT